RLEEDLRWLSAPCPKDPDPCIDELQFVDHLVSNIDIKPSEPQTCGRNENKSVKISKVIPGPSFGIKRANHVQFNTTDGMDGLRRAAAAGVLLDLPAAPSRLTYKSKGPRNIVL